MGFLLETSKENPKPFEENLWTFVAPSQVRTHHSTPWFGSLNPTITTTLWQASMHQRNIMLLNNHHEWQALTITTTLRQASMSPTCQCVPFLEWNAMLVTNRHVMLGHCCEICSIFVVSSQPSSRHVSIEGEGGCKKGIRMLDIKEPSSPFEVLFLQHLLWFNYCEHRGS